MTVVPSLPHHDETVDALVLENLWLADRIARRYQHRGESLEDLTQVARLGLVEAARRFDPGRGNLLAYVTTTINGVIKRHFRDHGWSVRPPRRTQELVQQMRRHWAEVAQTTGQLPSAAELAERMHEPITDVVAAQQANQGYRATRLETLLEAGWRDESEVAATSFRQAEARLEVQGLLAGLTDAECRLLQLRFVDELSQAEIAGLLGTSQMQVSRLLSRLLGRLRRELEGATALTPGAQAA